MPAFQQTPAFQPQTPAGPKISPLESVRYTSDLLENLRKLAQVQGQGMLAHLLELAQVEAKLLARDLAAPARDPHNQVQPTRLPG